jgi:UDP-N-acetylmuramoyl-tripeptide--D-alanyl-D-alanine ligase
MLGVILPLIVAVIISNIFEKILFEGFKKEAKKKLKNMKNLRIIAITASYGKTSIKNFLFQILNPNFDTYMTPKSVNTEAGIIKDINTSLPKDTEVYIVEAGARQREDIKKIVDIVQNDYAIVGKIGPAHIEYFKTLQNIRDTKMEIIQSKKLKVAYIHESATVKPNKKIIIFGNEIKNIYSTLEGLKFDIELDGKIESFYAKNILGEFNAVNITVAVLMAKKLGIGMDKIKKRVSNLIQIEHRLQKIEAGGKLIIDDSYNGNLEGMISSYELVSLYKGRKVIVTPGIIESTKEANITLAKKIDEIFDLAIITGKINSMILLDNLKRCKKLILADKRKLQKLLAKETKDGDLILFSNDAPTFI